MAQGKNASAQALHDTSYQQQKTEQLRKRLIEKLKELFQLDQPDLDFGFFRVMHAKAEQVNHFLENDLVAMIEASFGNDNGERRAELQSAYEEALQQAREYGAPEPEAALPVVKAKKALDAAKETAGAEPEIYDHLYRFFERYYDGGDFLSRRYYARETGDQAAPYAIPYSGEEVKLHWANADQYYIKTSEYFANFTFDLRQAAERQQEKNKRQKSGASDSATLFADDDADQKHQVLRVHFQIVEAAEGEHGNVKESEKTKRFFLIHQENPIEFNEQGELVIKFEYRPDPEKSGQDNTWRDKRNAEAVSTVLNNLEALAKSNKQSLEYLRLLKIPSPIGKDQNRPLLAKYLNQYTARNTMDYFIHKDLGGFLRRELDFYIKNEVMWLDDIENAEAPAVEAFLAKVKVLRKIGSKLIDFLAQLEDFQKKLWLKKKFVVETNYCITLDRVPEELYPEIATNKAQHEEWIKLFAINEIKGYNKPLTVKFLKANNKLVLDTRFFDDAFKAQLIASIENFDEKCDGLLIHSENFQAINLLKGRYRKQVNCVYIDPPYNTSDSKILYKNVYDSSAWLTLMENRIQSSRHLLNDDFVYFTAIDDYEMVPLSQMIDTHFPFKREMIIVNHHPQGGKGTTLANTHEYMLVIVDKESDRTLIGRAVSEDVEERSYKRSGSAESNFRYGRPNSFYAILVNPKTLQVVGLEQPPEKGAPYPTTNTTEGYKRIYPIGRNGAERVWRKAYESGKKLVESGKLKCSPNFTIYQLIEHGEKKTALFSNWTDKKYNAGTNGANLLNDIIGEKNNPFSYPKSIYTVEDALFTYQSDEEGVILDFFGGSGTTGHAVINLNKNNDGNRKYVLVEMGNHFDTVLKARVTKVVYSDSWKDGKPTARDTGISHCFKYIRLESYEDTLNNLRFEEDALRSKAIATNTQLKEDYLLRYLLDVETQGSPSLLNVDAFADPTAYQLKVKKPGTDEYINRHVDLLETFNYLIGLRVEHIGLPETYTAKFERTHDPELPKDQRTRLAVKNLRTAADGPWWFRPVVGWVPADPAAPNNGQQERVLIIWRKLTGNLEQDNAVLEAWFAERYDAVDAVPFDTIYVNGSNSLQNRKTSGEDWKVLLTEEEFLQRMWEEADS